MRHPGRRTLTAGLAIVLLLQPFASSALGGQDPEPSQEPASVEPRYRSPYFDSKGVTVEHLVELALATRADVHAARARLTIAEGRLTQSGLRPNPQLEFGLAPADILGPRTNRAVEIGVSQRFELGSKRSKRVEAARLEFESTRMEITALERRSAADIRAAVVQAWVDDHRTATLDALIRINEDLLKTTRTRLDTGDVAPVEALLLEQETDRLRTELVQAKAALDIDIQALRALVGLEPSTPLLLADLASAPPRLDAQLADLTTRALATRADLCAARVAEQSAEAKLRLAQAGATPDVTASITYTGDREATAPGEIALSRRTLRFGVSIEIPVLDRNQGEVRSATGDLLEARRQREFLEAVIQRDVAIAYRKYRAAAESLALYSGKILPRARQLLATVRQAYSYGEFSIFDVLAEQRRTAEAEVGFSTAIGACFAALAELEAAIGAPLPATLMGASPLLQQPPSALDVEAFRRSLRLASGSGLVATGPIVDAETTKGKDR